MTSPRPIALVTGAARRVGARIVERLCEEGYRVILHYRHSGDSASALAERLNREEAGRVQLLQADLNSLAEVDTFARQVLSFCEGQLALLVNNASSFYPTPAGEVTAEAWDDLFNSNLKGPFFLTQALLPALRAGRGAVVNIVDVYAERPLTQYPVYSMAKAGVAMMTKALARDLAPDVRVNGVSPGAILWSGHEPEDEAARARYLERIPLRRLGDPTDIADAVLYFARAPYVTGQIMAVDGGRTVMV